jgi:hypothetical protein
MQEMVEVLPERLDRLERLMAASELPVLVELGLMLPGTLDDDPHRSRRELASDDCETLDVDRGFVVAVTSMEVRPAEMVDLIVIHPDHDPVERTDSGTFSMIAA